MYNYVHITNSTNSCFENNFMCGGKKFKRNSAGSKFENPDVCTLCIADHFCHCCPERLSNVQQYNLV